MSVSAVLSLHSRVHPPDILQPQPLSPAPGGLGLALRPLHLVLTPALTHRPVWLQLEGSRVDRKTGPQQRKWRGGDRMKKKRKAADKGKVSGEHNVNEVDHFDYSDSKPIHKEKLQRCLDQGSHF